MSGIATAIVGSQVIGGIMSSDAQQGAADTAAGAQIESTKLGIDAQQKQFDTIQKLLAPYVNAGTGSLGAYQDLLGLNGTGKQQTAINGIQGSPIFTGLMKQGEDAILANASATGGLRGGNVQAALEQFRPNLLSQLINEHFSRLGGLVSLGENASAGVGNAGVKTGGAISDLLQQQGAAQAGAALAGGRADAGMWNTIGNSVGTFAGLGGFKGIGNTGTVNPDTPVTSLGGGITIPSTVLSNFGGKF